MLLYSDDNNAHCVRSETKIKKTRHLFGTINLRRNTCFQKLRLLYFWDLIVMVLVLVLIFRTLRRNNIIPVHVHTAAYI